MALITSYTTLQSELKDEFNRSADTASPWTRFIQSAEEAFIRDPRVKRMRSTTLSVDSEEESLPSDFKEMVSLTHDGPVYFDPIEIVSVEMLPGEKVISGGTTSGVVRKAAILDDGARLRFAPAPDTTYTLDFSYWQTITPLSATTQSNWLLDAHSDLYLSGCVLEAAKYFLDDRRFEIHTQVRDMKLKELMRKTKDVHQGGALVRRIYPIG